MAELRKEDGGATNISCITKMLQRGGKRPLTQITVKLHVLLCIHLLYLAQLEP